MIPFNKQILAATKTLRYRHDLITYRKNADKEMIRNLKDINIGKTVLVVGNGPSLNRTPLSDFERTPSIGMNKIDLIYDRTKWRPQIVVCLNNLVARQHQNHFASSEIPSLVAWKSRHFIKRSNRKNINYFNTLKESAFSTDALHGFGSSATVTFIALQLAYWMGAQNVILFGVDHSFQFKGETSTYQKTSGPDHNHFDPNYFKSGTFWGTPDLDQSEVDYHKARIAYQAKGRKIFDATIDGKLTVFPKISLDEARKMVE